MSGPDLEQLDREIERQLPALPAAVMEVLDLIDRGDVNLAALEQRISRDQTLAARILRLANSPFYGCSQQVASIRQACVVLGIHTIRNVVTAVGVLGRFPPVADAHFNRFALWQHAIGTGVAARALARHCGRDQEAAFTAGLLHDIGKLVLDVCFPEPFAEALRRCEEEGGLLREAEAAVFGFDHAVVGGRVARRWRLPATIADAIELHHAPDRAHASPLADLVHVADIVCRGLEIGSGGDDLIPAVVPGALQRLGYTWESIGTYLAEIEALNAASNLLAT